MSAVPSVLACSHGTSSPAGRRAIAALVQAVAARLPRVRVAAAFVDVEQPDVPTALAALDGEVRVVPLLLSAGYHVYVDLTEAVAQRPDTTLRPALGPDARLAQVLERRLRQAGLRHDQEIVLCAAGSSDPRAVEDCERAAALLAARVGRAVQVAFLSAAQPRVQQVVARAGDPGRVAVANYLLAPGYFDDLARRHAPTIAAPLLRPDEPPPPELVEIVIERAGVGTLAG